MMKYLLWVVLPFVTAPAFAQTPQPPPSGSAAFAGQLATMLAQVIEERDTALKHAADLQHQLDDLTRQDMERLKQPEEPK